MPKALSRLPQKWIVVIIIIIFCQVLCSVLYPSYFIQYIQQFLCKALFLSPFYWWRNWGSEQLSNLHQISQSMICGEISLTPKTTHLTNTCHFLSHYTPPAFPVYFHSLQMDGSTIPQIMKLLSSLSLHYSRSWITASNCPSSPPSAHTVPTLTPSTKAVSFGPREEYDRTSQCIYQKSLKLLINGHFRNTISEISWRL